MTIFLTSDWHISHRNIISYCNRPFQNIEEMDREIIARHNSVVKPEDTVYNLGDFAFSEKRVVEVLQQLNGKQILIPGNHDDCHSVHKKYLKFKNKYLRYGFHSVEERMELQIGKYKVLLCHLPYANQEETKIRYAEYRPINKGQILLHGHVHQHWLTKDKMINVGVDVWNFTPASEHQILELIERF